MRKKSLVLLLLFAAAACSGPRLPATPRGEPIVTVGGDLEGGPRRLGRGDLDALPRRAFHAVDPAAGSEQVWEGAQLMAIVERAGAKKAADVVVARTDRKEAIAVPVAVIRQLRPVLADRVDGRSAPSLVLAWPNVDQPGLDTDPRSTTWWAHGVEALDLVEWDRTFGRALRVPPGAPDAARLGSDQFSHRCIACHALRGAGGAAGPDLTTVAERISWDGFVRTVEKHAGGRARRGGETPPNALADLWAFLRSVATAGTASDEPPAEKR